MSTSHTQPTLDQLLERISRNYDRLDEQLEKVESQLPDPPPKAKWRRPQKPR